MKNITIAEARNLLNSGKISSVELISEFIKRAKDFSSNNSLITETFEHAKEKAKESDVLIAKGEQRVLESIPIAVKDLFCTKDFRTTCASKMLENFIPKYESTVTQKLWDLGAIMIGKSNMDEFAMGSSNITSHFGPVINKYKRNNDNEDLVSGGSSGGSAVAVSLGIAIGALGSDTGGSIRQPASFTGTVGVQPTYGRCSRYGMIAFASSLDRAGIFANNVTDSAILLKEISGHDEKDSTSIKKDVPDFSKLLNTNIKGKKIGIPKEYKIKNIPTEIEELWSKGIQSLKSLGAEIVEVSMPHTKYAPSVYYIVASAECSSNLARYDGVRYGHKTKETNITLEQMYEKTRSEGFGFEVKRRILTGTYVLSSGYYDAYYKKASKVRNLILNDFKEVFRNVDAILTPTAPNPAFSIAESINSNNNDPVLMYLNDVFTIPASLAGMPAISIPFGISKLGLPLGLQIISDHFCEQKMFDIALAMEKYHN